MSTNRTISAQFTEAMSEAHRQVSICNACRYCEGYCAVFPAMHRQRVFSSGDVTQMANLCHNCRGCYYSCQYTEPHEFKVNLPMALADVQALSWQRCIWPSAFAKYMQHSGAIICAAMIILFTALFSLVFALNDAEGAGFYAIASHTLLITIFIPAFVAPLWVIIRGLQRYWKGCNYENQDRFSNQRRVAHQLTMYGFVLCFAATVSGTLLHYFFNVVAPHGLLSLPKLFGLPGGILLTVGCIWLARLKTQADRSLSSEQLWGAEMAFILVLGATGATGLLLYAVAGTALVSVLLALHLATVLTFFVTMPYSKMVHGFFRLAALIKEAQAKSGYT